jgi:hypothetical protein
MSTQAQTNFPSTPTRKRLIQVTLLAWVAVIGFDFLMNAGLLAPFYKWELPGFLPPLKMFQYIPLGYAAFLLWSVVVVWLVVRLHAYGARAGAIFGAKLGGLLSGAAFLGWLSIFAFPAAMLFCWSLDHFLTFALVGAIAGSGLAAPRLRSLTWRVIVLVLICVSVSFVMQNLGLVPARTVHGGRIGIGWDPNR